MSDLTAFALYLGICFLLWQIIKVLRKIERQLAAMARRPREEEGE